MIFGLFFFKSPQWDGGCWDLDARRNVCLLWTEAVTQESLPKCTTSSLFQEPLAE